MPNNGEPVTPAAATDANATASQPAQESVSANPAVEVPTEVKSYLKGLGLDNAQVTPEFLKLAEAGMKQKSSVSRLSLEKEQLLARLEGQGVHETAITEEEPREPEVQQPAAEEPKATGNISDNDLFRLSRTIATDFPELSDLAQDGSLFRELRQLGYFKASGINERETYNYLAAKNAQLKELRELREFKEQHSRVDTSTNPAYNPRPGLNMDGDMNEQLARSIVYSGDAQNKRYQEAVHFLQDKLTKRSGF